MGLIDFVKSAGSKIFGKDQEPDSKDAEQFNRQRAEMLERSVSNLGIDIDDFQVEADDDKVTLRGTAKTQEDREKAVLVLGNQAGVARVDDQLEVAEPAAEATFHTVESGDTLWAIAEKHYGNGSKYTAIFEANTPMLSDPDKIYPGQKLRIPKLD